MDHKEEMTERAQLVRLYESNSQIAYPTPMDLRFRTSLMFKLGRAFGLKPGAPANAEEQKQTKAK